MSELTAGHTTHADAGARLDAIIASSRDAIVATDLDGAITAWGPGATRIAGYAEHEILGRPVTQLLIAEHAGRLAVLLRRLQRGHRVDDLQTVVRHKDGPGVHVSLTLAPIKDATGCLVGVSAIARDITASIVAERRSRRVERDIDAQQRILEHIARGDDLRTVLDLICREVEARYANGRCSVLTVDHGERTLRHAAGPSFPASFGHAIDRMPVAIGMGACGTAAARREEVVVADVLTDPLTAAFRDLAREHQFRSTWSHPLVDRDGQILGTFAVHTPAPHDPGYDQRRLVRGAGRLAALAIERRRYEEALTLAALVDPLTALPNRAGFLDWLRRALDGGAHDAAVLFLDLDQFKRVNDTLGHPAGDRLLREAAKRLQSVLAEGDVLSRFGGDEFIVLIRDATVRYLGAVAEDLLGALAEPFVLEGREFFLSGSIGVALAYEGAEPFDLIRDADVAMYEAKGQGAGRYAVFGEQLRQRTVERVTLDAELRRALDRRELVVQYQPMFDLATMRCTGAEALVRWHHPHRGVLGPVEFVPHAEESGLITRVGAVVLDEVLRQLGRWDQQVAVPVGVNVSAVELSNPGLVDEIEAALERHAIAPHRLLLEITETAVMEQIDTACRSLERLAQLGIGVFIDDFGTGYSSIGRLSDLPVTGLKVDRRFTVALGSDPSITKVTVAIIDLAHALDLQVVAEGIETQGALDELLALGCTHGQGFLLGRPAGPEEIASLV